MVDIFLPDTDKGLVLFGNFNIGIACSDSYTYHFISERITLVEIDEHFLVFRNNILTPHLLLLIVFRRTLGSSTDVRESFLGIGASDLMIEELAVNRESDGKRVLTHILSIGASVKN